MSDKPNGLLISLGLSLVAAGSAMAAYDVYDIPLGARILLFGSQVCLFVAGMLAAKKRRPATPDPTQRNSR